MFRSGVEGVKLKLGLCARISALWVVVVNHVHIAVIMTIVFMTLSLSLSQVFYSMI